MGHLRGKTVYNVIDFILIHQKLKKFLKYSNTYRGTLTQSDHNLLIVQIKNPKPYKCWTNQSKNYNKKPNFQDLITQQAYKKSIETSRATSLEEILISIKQVSNTSFKKSSKKTPSNRYEDHELHTLADKQKTLRNLIENSTEIDKINNLKTQRNKIKTQIKNRSLELYNNELETKVKIIETLDYNRQMHAAIKELSIKSNTTAKPLKLKDLMQHYKSKFSKNNQHTTKQYNNSKINTFEVENAIKKLKTNKSPGEDNIFSEELKLLGTNIEKTLTAAVNKELQSNNFPQSIFNHGIIIPITKKGKPLSPVNARPVILLNTIRKLIINNTQ